MNEVSLPNNKMAYRPVGRLLLTMALPTMASMIVQAMYNIVDSIFIARIGEEALTAVSLAFPIQMLMISAGTGTAVGVNSLLSRRLGEKRRQDAELVAGNSLFLAFSLWTVFAIIGLVFVEPFFGIFTDNTAIAPLGIAYTRICTIASLGIFGQIISERIMQATGDTVRPMLVQLTGAIINLILDPLLIFGLAGFPKLGVTGAALATVIGQWIAMSIGFIMLKRHQEHVSIKLHNIKPNWPIIKEIYKVGLPSIIMQSIGSVMTVGMNKILIAFSATAVSVFGVYFKLQSFVFMPVFGITLAMIPIVGFNFGARNPQRIAKAVKTAALMAFTIMSAGLLMFQLLPEFLLSLFDASADMYQLGIRALRIISLHFPLAAIAIMFSSSFQAIGKGMYSLILSLVRQLVFLLPSAYILAQIDGLNAIWFAFIISEVVSVSMATMMFINVYRKKIKPLSAHQGDISQIKSVQ
ncbi:MAG: MATE family efflux transporter [Sphaerochaetaceae bacterium]|jgi:putative MATE family efflux protein|nr:MATE family efflux transporter [Sphaerochaetaceae bacterium]